MTAPRLSAEERRRHLCAVARQLFLDSGYRATTTAAVAEAAQVSEALMLKHFGTKDALFREALAEPLVDVLRDAVDSNWNRVLSGSFDTVDDQVSRLQEFGVGWATLLREHGPLLLAVLREAKDFPDIVTRVAEMVASTVDQVAESLAVLTRGDDYADFDAKVATYAGLAAMAAGAVAGRDIDAYMREFVPMLMFGLLSQAGRERSSRSASHALEVSS